jgi:hypothetical protein
LHCASIQRVLVNFIKKLLRERNYSSPNQIRISKDFISRDVTWKCWGKHHKAIKKSPKKAIEEIILDIPQKKAAMKAIYKTGHDTMIEIAQYYHVHYRTVSRAIR